MYVLLKLGFKATFIIGTTLMRGKLFKRPNNHGMIIVEVDGDEYLIDTHFGYNGIRFPLKIKYDEPTIIEIIQGETYKISFHED